MNFHFKNPHFNGKSTFAKPILHHVPPWNQISLLCQIYSSSTSLTNAANLAKGGQAGCNGTETDLLGVQDFNQTTLIPDLKL
jgi:hypothetical protein